MTDKRFSELTSATTVGDTDILAISQSGVSKQLPASVLKAYAQEGSAISVSDTAPASPVAGQLWYDTANGVLLIYYNSGSLSQWVEDYESQLTNTVSLPDMNGGTASTTSWTYSINCGASV